MERMYELQVMRYYATQGEPYMALTNYTEDMAQTTFECTRYKQ